MLTHQRVTDTIDAYVTRHPDAEAYVRPLRSLIDDGAQVMLRSEYRGHVTAGAFVIDPNGKLLVIRHNALGRWLTPGGHVETEDASVFDAALRELREELGLQPSQLWAPVHMLCTPVHIDCHPIPANAKKNEPPHDHWDFRFLFLMRDPQAFTLQLDEVSDAQWIHPATFERHVADAIARALA